MPKTKYSDLKDDERCIYQAVGDLEGGSPETHCHLALMGGAKEVDDEAAIVVLAKHYGYAGPSYAIGKDFNSLNFADGTKILAICTGSQLKKALIGADSEEMAKMLMDPTNTNGVSFHAIGIVINHATRIIHDQQKLRKNGPNAKDDVIYWTK